MHPILEEFCRARELQTHVLRRMQREMRDTIQPLIDIGESAAKRIADLEAENESLRAKAAKKAAA